MMRTFLAFEFTKFAKYFKTKTLAKVITTIMFLVVFAFVAQGVYYFFLSGFRFINYSAVEDIRLGLTLFIYEVFLLVLMGLVVFGALVSGVFNLFRANNNSWILSSPSFTVLPRMVFVKGIIASFLPLVVVFLPAVLAFAKINKLDNESIFFILLSVSLLIVSLQALTLLFVSLVGTLYYRLTKLVKFIPFTFKGYIAIILLILTSFIAYIWRVIITLDLGDVFKGADAAMPVNVESIASYFSYLPTHPLAMQILYWQNGQIDEALLQVSIVLIMAIVLSLLWWFDSKMYYPLWQKFQEGTVAQSKNTIRIFGSGVAYKFTGSILSVLFKKELLISTRNLKDVMWFLFLLFIWLLQIGANLVLENNVYRHTADISQKIILLQTIQFIIAVYFISAFTLRFVFPSFSIERKTSWILGTAPINFLRVFFGKYFFFTAFFIGVGILMSYLNSLILGVTLAQGLYSVGLLIFAILFVETLGLFLGATFPNTETDDPEVISTSMPGLFFTGIALIYGAMAAWVLRTTLNTSEPTMALFFIVCTIGAVGVLLSVLPRRSSVMSR
jgi:hypothetical protein